ncbi:metallophosphoesterase [Photobacterium sp. ZSDE20]|uniref:Metallophosphoesterase n=1 Tax=Photobacterium pectinilyticum TaxID=2906793 RepID=A0ABT1N5C4_9GAMM|nr:metallophosphoesterase [Photobacterium sp. ZSDE20]MCQ1059322.1 metallophosphoesterase [Photobacterium sp. ZSDE20]MDD1825581.1 metallophosphoesterase [Photobacterium sp. ZSDE20]
MFSKKNVSRRSFMGGMAKVGTVAASTSILTACNSSSSSEEKTSIAGVKVAMLADVHFHDVFGHYEFSKFNSEVTIRSMQDSCESTRMFNENYFAFIEALEELGQQGIKYICLLGDFSDDGQVDTLKGFNRVVEPYIEKYGFEFFLTNGNHDPVRPYGAHQTKNFLHHTGASIAVTSDEDRNFTPNNVLIGQHITKGMWATGYQEMFDALGQYGFQNKPSYVSYETPWGSDKFEDRGLMISKEDGGNTFWCPDATYLAEPVEGLWIVSVDMNIYLPNDDGTSWSHASIGWEEGKKYKPQVMDWLANVTARAEAEGKTLIVFSHYPATEYLNSSANDFYYVFNDGSYNNTRVPSSDTAEQVINAGVKMQFGGHIHVNDTAVHQGENGTLINIQAPSLAAYTPSYKVVTCHSPTLFEIETKTLQDVRDFDALFPYYQLEKEHREWVGADVQWETMLEATDYRDFMFRHLDVLMHMRLKNGWGGDITALFEAATPLYWLMMLSCYEGTLDNQQTLALIEAMTIEANNSDILTIFAEWGLEDKAIDALAMVDGHCSTFLMNRDQMMAVSFKQLCLATLYQRNGDELALQDLNYQLLVPIRVAMEMFKHNDADGDLENIDWDTDYINQNPASGGSVQKDQIDLLLLRTRFASFARIYHQLGKAKPADHFFVDLTTGYVEDLAGNKQF